MKKTKLVTIICWTISALALLGLIVWLLVGGIFNIGFGFDMFGVGTFDVVGSHSVPADNISSLDVDWTSGRVYIGTHDGNDIQITEFARRNLRDGEAMGLGTDGDTLTIRFSERRMLHVNLTKQLEILIPRTLSENFEDFHVNTVSGRVDVSNIGANDVAISTTSGRIELRGITTQSLNASTTSGRIELSGVQAEEGTLRTVSGRIEAFNTEVGRLQTQTTSGRHDLSGSFDTVNARSVSGRIELTSRVVPDSLTAHATSGRITITVPGGEAISVQHSTGSGRFSSNIPIITHGGEGAQFELSTASGRISIYELR
ncbi:MAG: DUF4097 domain-containing protein [Oscillospiraceae bacterium]|nr:DUF4097 domain-containing protein [Oscillospiraceae bacterium]